MAHIGSQSAYQRLTERLNRFPQGAPPAELLTKILKVLFDQREAELVSLLPIRPFTVKRAADVWRMSESRAHKILDQLAEKALLVDFYVDGDMQYVLPPPMAGFFEFSMMRVREDIDQRLLANCFTSISTWRKTSSATSSPEGRRSWAGPLSTNRRCRRQRPSCARLRTGQRSDPQFLPPGLSICYCRHKMTHLGRACTRRWTSA